MIHNLTRKELEQTLNEENRAIWFTLQPRYRNYITTAINGTIIVDNEHLQKLVRIAMKRYEKYKPVKPRIKTKKINYREKYLAIKKIIEDASVKNEAKELGDRYELYENGYNAGVLATKEAIKEIMKGED